MDETLHITSGDSVGEMLRKSGLPGWALVWRDVLYDGLRHPGWPDNDMLEARAAFLEVRVFGSVQPQMSLMKVTPASSSRSR